MTQPPSAEHEPDAIGGGPAGTPPPVVPNGAEVLNSESGQQPTTSVLPRRSGSGRRRGVLIGAGVLAVALVGGGVAVAASQLSGAGAQPDEAVPATAVAYLAVDLDPSAGQKVGALRFARKFPALADKLHGGDDLRKALFESLRDDELDGDWAKDVEPWLGQRAAFAVMPAHQDGDDPDSVVVLAITDRAKAKAGIAKVTDGEARCAFTPDFAVCAQDAATAARTVKAAATKSLSEADGYRADVQAVGDQGIAHAWVDLAAVKDAVPTSGDSLSSALRGGTIKGRTAFALRFDGPHLELAGRTFGIGLPAMTGAVDASVLPADTMSMVSLSGADRWVATIYAKVREVAVQQNAVAQLDRQVQRIEQETGVKIPSDIAAAVGPQLSVLFGGLDAGRPKVAARFSGDRGKLEQLARMAQFAVDGPLGVVPAGTDTVVGSSRAYADAVAKGTGLADQQAFRAAVPNADQAQVVLYANIARAVDAYGSALGLDAKSRANLAPLAGIGLRAQQDGDGQVYSLRLTTR